MLSLSEWDIRFTDSSVSAMRRDERKERDKMKISLMILMAVVADYVLAAVSMNLF